MEAYTPVLNDFLTDTALSVNAYRVMGYLATKATIPGWLVRWDDVAKHCGMKRTATKNALAELARAGYTKVTRVNGPGGQIRTRTTIVAGRVTPVKPQVRTVDRITVRRSGGLLASTESTSSTETSTEVRDRRPDMRSTVDPGDFDPDVYSSPRREAEPTVPAEPKYRRFRSSL